jgi:hypothetical protein
MTVVQRAGVRAFKLRPVWRCPLNEAGGGGHRRVLANFLRVFKTSLSCPDLTPSQFHSWGRKRTPIHFIIRSIPLNAGRMRLSASTAGVGFRLWAAKAARRATTSATMTARARGLVPSLGMRSYCRLYDGLLPGAGRFTGGATIHFRRWGRDA